MDKRSKFSVDDFLRTTVYGSKDRGISDALYGLNNTDVSGIIEGPTDSSALLFMTRPDLNLSADNIRTVRQLYPLLTKNEYTLQRWVRATLDPHYINGFSAGKASVAPGKCGLVNNQQAFIPVLTNALKTMSGWPDYIFPKYTSSEGNFKQVYQQVDGTAEINNDISLSATFSDLRGNPILQLFTIWGLVATLQYEGRIAPWPNCIMGDELNYTTRMFTLVLDEFKHTVTHIASASPGFHNNVPMGEMFNINREDPASSRVRDINIQFSVPGVEYDDPILITEFNTLGAQFKPELLPEHITQYMIKLPIAEKNHFKHTSYPRINVDTLELEWWVDKPLYHAKINKLKQTGLI